MFVESARLNTSFKDKITGDNVAVALSFDTVRAVGGYIKPGDEVNLLLVDPVKGANPDTSTAVQQAPAGTGLVAKGTQAVEAFRLGGLNYENDVRYFYEKVRILAIGAEVLRSAGETANTTTATTATEGPGQAGVIVFLVPADVAQRLLAAGSSKMYMTLPSETWKPVAVEQIPVNEFDKSQKLPAEDPNRLTPYGPTGYKDQSTVSSTGSSGSGSTSPTTTR